MASPQKEDGYLVVAREIQNALCRTRIPGEVRQIVDVVIRQTYGYKRKEDVITLDQFCLMTEMKKPTVCRSIKSALDMKLIIKNDNPNPVYQFNKDYDEWKRLSKKIITKSLSKMIIPVIKNDNPEPLTLYVSKESTRTVRKRTFSPNYTKRVDDNDSFSREEFLKSMRSSPQPHMRFLAEYADEKNLNFETKGQWRFYINRNVKPASRISKYSDNQIAKAFDDLKKDLKTEKNKKGFITKWTIETLEKYLDK